MVTSSFPLSEQVLELGRLTNPSSCESLICNFATVDALQLLKADRNLPPIGGAVSEDERGLGSGRNLSVD